MKYCFTILSIFLVLCVSLFTQNVFSQESFTPSSFLNPDTGLPIGIEEQVTVEQIPSIPKPGELVNVRIVSYSTDLNKATISWTLNGRSIVSQIGATTFSFQAPESGKTSSLVIRISKEGGGVISKTITVSPADVDLIYEADTYVHPFYKGKRQYTSESNIKFIAIPNFATSGGVKIADSNLVYTWKINGTVQQNASGYGRNTYSTKGTLIERISQISVEVSAVNSSLKASQALNFRSISPEIVLYENNPILGVVYEQAIQGTFSLKRPQVDFEVVPYFFSTNYKDSADLNYSWSINGTKITNKSASENYLLLRNEKNEDGRALIGVDLKHVQNLLQTTKASIELDFKKVENETNNEQFTF